MSHYIIHSLVTQSNPLQSSSTGKGQWYSNRDNVSIPSEVSGWEYNSVQLDIAWELCSPAGKLARQILKHIISVATQQDVKD